MTPKKKRGDTLDVLVHVPDVLEAKCLEYLTDQHCTLWSRAFDIHNSTSRDVAARWLAGEIRGLVEHIRNE